MNEANDTPPDLEQLLDSLRQEAVLVEQGGFKIQWSKALDKIQQHALPDKNSYVLEWIRGGIQSGAPEVRVLTDANDVMVQFDRVPLPEPDRDFLFNSLFAEEKDRNQAAVKSIAIGLVTAIGLEPKFVVVQVSSPEGSWRMAFESLQHIQIDRSDKPSAEFSGTRLWIRERFSAKVVAEAIAGNPEEDLIIRFCRFSRVPVWLNRKTVTGQPEEDARIHERFDENGLQGGAWADKPGSQAALDAAPQVILSADGVMVEQLPIPRLESYASHGLTVWLDGTRFELDLSRRKLIRDEVFDQAMDLAYRQASPLLHRIYFLEFEGSLAKFKRKRRRLVRFFTGLFTFLAGMAFMVLSSSGIHLRFSSAAAILVFFSGLKIARSSSRQATTEFVRGESKKLARLNDLLDNKIQNPDLASLTLARRQSRGHRRRGRAS